MKRMSPVQAIRQKCLWCMAGSAAQVNKCYLENCPLWVRRFGKKPKLDNSKNALAPVKSIKTYCFECSNFNKAEIRNCYHQGCALYSFRRGKNLNWAGVGGKVFQKEDTV